MKAKLVIAVVGTLVAWALVFCGVAASHTARVHVPVKLHEGACPDIVPEPGTVILGCYFEKPVGTYNVYWADQDHLTLAHELGHVYDVTSLRSIYRDAFRAIFNLPDTNWYAFNDQGFSAAEWFAEGYGRCRLHWPYDTVTAYNYYPTRLQHRAVCRLIWLADRDRL